MHRPPVFVSCPDLPFDPVCGNPLENIEGPIPLSDGERTYRFCSAMCRRIFLDERRARQAAAGAGSTPSHALSPGKR
jgi:YHS domain-containing protein